RETVGRRRDGGAFPVDLATSETHFGEARMAIWLVRDITERKRADAELHAALAAQRAASEQSERLHRLKSDFVSIVSHEFRTALTGVQGFSEMIRDEDLGPEEVKEFAADINQTAQRLN